MLVLFRAVLLVLLVLLVPGSDAVCDLEDKILMEDLNNVAGSRWILVEAFADDESGRQDLAGDYSSFVEIRRNADEETFLLEEKNLQEGGKCLTFSFNATTTDSATSDHTFDLLLPGVVDLDGNLSVWDTPGEVTIYQTDSHCMNLIYQVSGKRMLLIYRRDGEVDVEQLVVDQVKHQEIAENHNFLVPSAFKYDRTSEFCPEKKEEAKA